MPGTLASTPSAILIAIPIASNAPLIAILSATLIATPIAIRITIVIANYQFYIGLELDLPKFSK